MVIFPFCQRWQAHQYGLGTAIGLQAELCSPIPHAIEFHIPASPELLPFFFFFSNRDPVICFPTRRIERREDLTHAFYELKTRFLCEAVFSFTIIKEYPPDSPGFISLSDEKISIYPSREFLVVGWMMLITDIL